MELDVIMWWLSMVELPALAGLLGMVLRYRKELTETKDELLRLIDAKSSALRDHIASDKYEALKNFATLHEVRSLEKRLVSHLLRIEAKLDVTALKAEAFSRNNRDDMP